MELSKCKIGIRPTIDGRWGGIREGLEEQTMGMAKAAKALIEANLTYSDGTPVQVVIADSTIGGGREAALCADKFGRENVCGTLSVTPCWCYGSETMDLDPTTVKAVWGFNGTERPGAVYLAAVMAAHAQKGLPAFMVMTCRMPTTVRFRPTFRKRFCASPAAPLRSAKCATKLMSTSVRLRWASWAAAATRISSRSI